MSINILPRLVVEADDDRGGSTALDLKPYSFLVILYVCDTSCLTFYYFIFFLAYSHKKCVCLVFFYVCVISSLKCNSFYLFFYIFTY